MKINQRDIIPAAYNNGFQRTKSCAVTFGANNDFFESEFSKKKKLFANKFKDYKLIDKKLLTELLQCKNEEEYNSAINDILRVVFYNYLGQISDLDKALIEKAKKHQKTTLAFEQYFYNKMQKKDKEIIEIFKFLSEKDKNPEVLKVKNILTQKYGIKNVCLDNNPECAKLYLDAVKLLAQKDFPLPDNIIVSKYFPAGGLTVNSDGQSYIILPAEVSESLWMQSTQSPLHQFVHETVHSAQPLLFAFNIKRIPDKFKDTVDNLSIYASDNFTHEVHAELITKMLLEELTPEEKELKKVIER